MCLIVSSKKEYERKKKIFAFLKSMKKEVGSRVGSGSISQGYGSGDLDPHQKCHGSPTLSSTLLLSARDEPPWGYEPRIELGPALQQADALTTELRRTLPTPHRYDFMSTENKPILWQYHKIRKDDIGIGEILLSFSQKKNMKFNKKHLQ